MSGKRIRILVVDDSALIRALLTEIFRQQPDFDVVGAAPDPYVARELIRQHQPDVLTLDVEMPRMDGLDFLERLMHAHPMPVVMLSSLTEKGADVTLRALELGAVDFVTKPKLGISEGLREYAEQIVEKVRCAAGVRVQRRLRQTREAQHGTAPARQPAPANTGAPQAARQEAAKHPPGAVLLNRISNFSSTEKIVAIGASTGGTEAVRMVLEQLPANAPGIVIAQHMPAGFTRSFAERLRRVTRLHVAEAAGGERVIPGSVFIAPGDFHLLLARDGANYVTRLEQSAAVNRHRPSVDVLFDSVADSAAGNAIGVILTGMGKDGAQGLLRMRAAGAHTIGQDEASSVVYGMPREAQEIGAVTEQLPLDAIAGAILRSAGALSTRI